MHHFTKNPIRFLFAALLITILFGCQNKVVLNAEPNTKTAAELTEEEPEAAEKDMQEPLNTQGAEAGVYKNTKYGFQFNYPQQVTVEEKGDEIKIVFPIGEETMNFWSLKAYAREDKNESLNQWIKTQFNPERNKDCKEMDSGISVAGAKTVLLGTPSMDQLCEAGAYYTLSPNGLTVIQWNLGQDPQYSKEIIDSFKFI